MHACNTGPMTKLVGIVGSLRTASVNRIVAQTAVDVTAPGVALSLFDLAEVPMYNGDVEQAGAPQSVLDLHAAADDADGIVVFSPEYNGSFPAVVKNAIDWWSRPPRSWEGTAITMVSATPGPRGGKGVRDHFNAIMSHQPVRLFDETLGIASYGDKIVDGQLSDAFTRTELEGFLARFAEFAEG